MKKLMKIVRHQNNNMINKHVIVLENKNSSCFVEEISLSGLGLDSFHINEDCLSSDKIGIHWKAAFSVWKNNKIKEENEENKVSKDHKYRYKVISMLASKYNIDQDLLLKIIDEYDS